MGARGLSTGSAAGDDAESAGGLPARVGLRLAELGVEGLARVETERALAWAAAFGRGWARAGGPRVGDARTNLRIAFPEWSEARRARVLEDSFANLGRAFVEFAQLARLDRDALEERISIEGLEHFEEARAASKTGGVVVLTGHFGSWELLAAAMSARGYPIAVVFRPRDHPGLDRLVARLRASGGTELLGRGSAARGGLRALREGRLLAMPLDQNCDRDGGLFVPFFGRLACTRDGPVRVVMRTGVSVLPVFIHRVGESARHVVRVQPRLELTPPGEDREAVVRENVARMTRVIEEAIRERPDHWTWIHRRWRTAPPGEPHPYGRRRG